MFDQYAKKYHQWVWQCDDREISHSRKFLVRSLRIIQAIFRDLTDGQLSLRAMSLVYTTVIAIVPLLAICFSVLKGFGAHNAIEPALLNVLEPLGDKRIEITEKVIQFVDNIKVGVLGTLGLALLIYTVISMMQKIERAFNYTWHISQGRSFSQRLSDYLSVLLVGPLLIFLSAGITTSVRSFSIVEQLTTIGPIAFFLDLIAFLVPYLMLALAFTFIYYFMPNTKVRVLSAFVGGLITAVIWKLMGWGFSNIVVTGDSHTLIYAAFATLIIFMIWLYLGWLVLLMGASIAFYYQNPRSLVIREEQGKLSSRVKEKLALVVCCHIAKAFENGKKGCTVEAIADKTGLPIFVIDEIIGKLETLGLVIHSGTTPPIYIPARPIDNTSVYDVFSEVRKINEECSFTESQFRSMAEIDEIIKKRDSSLKKEFSAITLKDLVK